METYTADETSRIESSESYFYQMTAAERIANYETTKRPGTVEAARGMTPEVKSDASQA